jgi:hypothetical protein
MRIIFVLALALLGGCGSDPEVVSLDGGQGDASEASTD